jgi:hypothetical protein
MNQKCEVRQGARDGAIDESETDITKILYLLARHNIAADEAKGYGLASATAAGKNVRGPLCRFAKSRRI